MKVKECWIIIATNGSCLANAVCLDKAYAETWVKEENEGLGFEAYYIEQSQLIE